MASSNEILHLCRLCLIKENVNVSIFENGQIREKINTCLPVKVSQEDKLPKKICDGCFVKLDVVYDFYNASLNAEKQLLKWLGTKSDTGAASDISANSNVQSSIVKQEVQADIEEDDSKNFFDEEFNDIDQDEKEEEEEEETRQPPAKRAKRTAAVKAAIAMDRAEDDDEDEDDPGEPTTKMEDESDDSDAGGDHDNSMPEAPSTSAEDQPGPSGVLGQSLSAAEIERILSRKPQVLLIDILRQKPQDIRRKTLTCYVCLTKFHSQFLLDEHRKYCEKLEDKCSDSDSDNINEDEDFTDDSEDSSEESDSFEDTKEFDETIHKYKCDYCNVYFVSPHDAKMHVPNKKCTFSCMRCNRKFHTLYGFVVHIRTQHKSEEINENCKEPSETIKSEPETDSSTVSCEYCYDLVKLQDLEDHKALHGIPRKDHSESKKTVNVHGLANKMNKALGKKMTQETVVLRKENTPNFDVVRTSPYNYSVVYRNEGKKTNIPIEHAAYARSTLKSIFKKPLLIKPKESSQTINNAVSKCTKPKDAQNIEKTVPIHTKPTENIQQPPVQVPTTQYAFIIFPNNNQNISFNSSQNFILNSTNCLPTISSVTSLSTSNNSTQFNNTPVAFSADNNDSNHVNIPQAFPIISNTTNISNGSNYTNPINNNVVNATNISPVFPVISTNYDSPITNNDNPPILPISTNFESPVINNVISNNPPILSVVSTTANSSTNEKSPVVSNIIDNNKENNNPPISPIITNSNDKNPRIPIERNINRGVIVTSQPESDLVVCIESSDDDVEAGKSNEVISLDDESSDTVIETNNSSAGSSEAKIPKIFVKKLEDLIEPNRVSLTKNIIQLLNPPVKCDLCDMMFNRANLLSAHNKRKLQCTMCEYKCCRSAAMTRHYSEVHNRCYCEYCKFVVENQKIFLSHKCEEYIKLGQKKFHVVRVTYKKKPNPTASTTKK